MKRVAVVGTSGSGKTTFATSLSARLAWKHIEMDALHWEPNWTMADLDVFRARVTAATEAERWVCDGSYSKVRDIVWGRADTLVWLDYPLPIVLTRLLRRTFGRVLTREELWGGNRESLRNLFSRESLFLWAINQHKRNRIGYPAALTQPSYAHVRLHRFASPADAARWLSEIVVV